jgi:uncharacterized protein
VRVEPLWQYPVKSMRGQRLADAFVTLDGIPGDRLLHVRYAATGRVVTARRRPCLLGLVGGLDPSGRPTIDGRPWDAPESVEAVRHAAGDDAELVEFAAPDVGQRYDVLPLTILSDGMVYSLGYDYRRFRPNMMISGVEGRTEREWVGQALAMGEALIGVSKLRSRCVMTTFHPDTLEQDHGVLRRIGRELGGCLALDCWVIRPGRIAVGDAVKLQPLPPGTGIPEDNAARKRRVSGAAATCVREPN